MRLAIVAILSLAACGGAGPAGTTTSQVPAASAPTGAATKATATPQSGSGENPYLDAKLCSLISLQAVTQAAGGVDPKDAQPSDSPPASCRYRFGLPVGTFPSTAAIEVEMLSDYKLERAGAGASARDVAGIGDEAWERAHTDSLVLYVRRGDLVFRVIAAGGGDWTAMTRNVAKLVLATLVKA